MDNETIVEYVMNTPDNTNPRILRDMLGQLNSGGSDLPAVTSDDNGDVLTVVSGEWAKAAPSGGIYDENDLIIRMDYYFDEVAEKYALISITPSLVDIGERYLSDSPIGLERLIATQWDSAEKEGLNNRMVYDHVNFDSYESGEDTFCTLDGSFSSSIFPGDVTAWFDYYHIKYSEETDEVTLTSTSYAVDITEFT